MGIEGALTLIGTPDHALDYQRVLVAIGGLLVCLHVLSNHRELSPDGLLAAEFVSSRIPRRARVVVSKLGYRGALVVLLLKALASLVLLTGFAPRLVVVALSLSLSSQMLLNLRSGGLLVSGATRMETVVLGALLCAEASGRFPAAVDLALGFVCCQVLLAYNQAGWGKLKLDLWRQGTYLPRLGRAYSLTSFELLRGGSLLSLAVHWFMISWLTLSPLVLLTGPKVTAAWALTGVGFHLLNACLLGLYQFPWSFCAAYPAVFYVQSRVFG